MDLAEEVLFLAQTADASCYHRTVLPATTLGCDWGGLDSPPPRMVLGRGEVRFDQGEPDLGAYRIVVLQTPAQEGWLDVIPALQAAGTKVVFDADYYMHEISTDTDVLNLIESLLELCDGVTCATRYIAQRYARFNPKTFVCENGIDLRRYALTKPPHDTVNIGWAGSSAVVEEMLPWLAQIAGGDARPGRHELRQHRPALRRRGRRRWARSRRSAAWRSRACCRSRCLRR